MNNRAKNVLVTGINGFVGQHLARELNENGCTIIAVGQDDAPAEPIIKLVEKYYKCDLTDPKSVDQIALDGISAVINLAGLSSVGDSFGQKEKYSTVNTAVHTVLYDKMTKLGLTARVLAISSGSVYDPNQAMPINEEGHLLKEGQANPYTASKIRMEKELKRYQGTTLECIIVRPFNHIGPGQKPGFLVPDLAERIKIYNEHGSPVKVGNLDTRRDYTDVRDVAKAYVKLVAADNLSHRIYNVCSGKSIPGSYILDTLLSEFRSESAKAEVDATKIRVNDVMDIFGSYKKLSEDTGWRPTIPIDQTLIDFAEDYTKQKNSEQTMAA